jgi:hypothetical protein
LSGFARNASVSFDWQLTGTTHSKAYGDGCSQCEGYLQKNGTVFVRLSGPFGNMPETHSIQEARALAKVLTAIVAEHDSYQAAMTAEYGPPKPPHP